MKARVVVVGSINIDDVLPVSSWPVPGETMLLSGPASSGLGGKGANQAVAAALAGATVSFVGAVGDDAPGTAALNTLREHGVDVSNVRTLTHRPTGRATVLVHSSGENLILVDPGANGEVSGEVVESVREVIENAGVVLVQGEVPRSAVEVVADLCAASNTRFVLNLAPPIALRADVQELADPLVVNEIEAAHLGIDPDSPKLNGVRSLVVTRGANGALAVSADSATLVPSVGVDAVDTTGAGDAFVGTLAAALAAGADLSDACGAGAAAGALAVTRPGAAASYGNAAEVAAFISAKYQRAPQ